MSLINDALKRARQAQKPPTISPSGEGMLTAPAPLQPVEDTGREKSQRLLAVIPVLLLSLGASFWFFSKWKNAEAKAAASDAGPELTEVQTARPTLTNALVITAATMTKWQERQQSAEMEPVAEGRIPTRAQTKKAVVHPTEASLVNESARATNTSSPGSISISPVRPASPVSIQHSPTPTDGTTPALPDATPSAHAVSSGVTARVTPPPASAWVPVAIKPAVLDIPAGPTTEPGPEPKLQGIFYRLKRPTALIDGRIVSLGDDINGYRVMRIERDTVKLLAAGRTNSLTLH